MGDFGFAKEIQGAGADGVITSTLGTPGYMAPEIIENREYRGVAVDIFAMGVVLFSMVTGSAPFQGVTQVQSGSTVVQMDKLYELLLKDKERYFGRYQGITFSDDFISLICAMLHPDPLCRPTYADMVMHPWLQNDCASVDEAVQDMQDRRQARLEAQ